MPWDIAGMNERKRFRQVMTTLWASYLLWILIWLLVKNTLILLLPFLVYTVVTFTMLSDHFLHLRTFRCASCGLAWRRKRDKR